MKKTVSAVCADRWPQVMCPTWAAAYANKTLARFRQIPEYAALIKNIHGEEEVYKPELDALLEELYR